jgi:hypothetical protein
MAKAPTQQFLEIEEIRDGVIVLKNKSLRGVIMVSSLNFALKSEDEKKAILYQFQGFLNSLDFSVEILVQSRKVNMTGYLDKIKELQIKQENELLKIQIKDYYEFIKNLVGGGDIMAKTFYVIVPFTLVEFPTIKTSKKGEVPSLSEEQFQRAKTQLWQRMEFVGLGLRRCGLQCVPLNTEELIELFWTLYHPIEAEVGYYPEIPPELIK